MSTLKHNKNGKITFEEFKNSEEGKAMQKMLSSVQSGNGIDPSTLVGDWYTGSSAALYRANETHNNPTERDDIPLGKEVNVLPPEALECDIELNGGETHFNPSEQCQPVHNGESFNEFYESQRLLAKQGKQESDAGKGLRLMTLIPREIIQPITEIGGSERNTYLKSFVVGRHGRTEPNKNPCEEYDL